MTVEEFKQRLSWNKGPDRQFGNWQIIDIHHILVPLLDQQEVDFYCWNQQDVYLLRLRNRPQEGFFIVQPTKAWETLTYLIAERPISVIDDSFIESTLARFDLPKKV
ncbi:hypothetical protein [Fibrella aestuarina]|uniref:hypothetical protein n=1 Tax=Fibrella aestuarina TaxID=651143 RepID=UPI00059BFE3C|nr:hypothetical protein [Fibrella aestuarina]